MKLLLWIAFTIVTPSAYGQCLCTFPMGSYKGTATFERSGGEIITSTGKFFVKLNSAGLQYFRGSLESEANGMEYWFSNATDVIVCRPDCSNHETSYIPFPGCVLSTGTTKINQNKKKITSYERTNGGITERYDVILNESDTTICSPKKIMIGIKNIFENIVVDKLRDNSFYVSKLQDRLG